MKHQETANPGSLVLLGSEGVTPEFKELWPSLVDDSVRSVLLLAVPSPTPSLGFRMRLELMQQVLIDTGLTVQMLSIEDLEVDRLIAAPDRTTVLFVAADMPVIANDAPTDAVSHAVICIADICRRLVRSGISVIVGATAAAGLGETRIMPLRPFPRNPSDVVLATIPGADLFKGAAILPYFEHLSPQTLDKFFALAGIGQRLIGIDQGAALQLDSQGARCGGMGKVTIVRDNAIEWAGSGEVIPSQLIAPTLYW